MSLWTHDGELLPRHDSPGRYRVEKVRELLDYEAAGNHQDDQSTLTRLRQRLDPAGLEDPSGWNRQNARLYAIDAASTAIRHEAAALSEADRHNLTSYLQEAKELALSDRDDELGFLQSAMEAQLSLITPGERRQLWLTAIDSLIPSPYRAALVSTENAIFLGGSGIRADLSTLLADRLSVDSDAGSVRLEPTVQLHTTV